MRIHAPHKPLPSRSAKRLTKRALALGLLVASAGPAASASAAGDYIVVLKDNSSPSRVAQKHDRRDGVQVEKIFGTALKGYSARLSRGQAKRLAGDPSVAYVAPDRPVTAAGKASGAGRHAGGKPSGAGKPSGGGGGSTGGQTVPTGVNRIEGDLSGALSGNGTGAVTAPAVAVLDSGSGPHPDLNVAGGKTCIGKDYKDGNGHGTHVAGSIAAKDDGAGVVGVAPGAPIYSVRVLDASVSGTTASLLCGIDWVTANAQALGIKVANLSLEMAGSDDGNCGNTNADPVHQAICASVATGVSYVVAAGNSAVDFAQTAPAAYDEVLTVTAVSDTNGRPGGGGAMPNECSADPDDSSADFSNFAPIGSPDVAHTIAAPGKCLNSTWKGGGYRLSSGTSMAAPHASGAVALCIATGACDRLSPAGIIAKLRNDAAAQPISYGFAGDPRTPIGSRYFGHLVSVAGYRGSTTGGSPGGASMPEGTSTSPGGGHTTTGTSPRGKRRGSKNR